MSFSQTNNSQTSDFASIMKSLSNISQIKFKLIQQHDQGNSNLSKIKSFKNKQKDELLQNYQEVFPKISQSYQLFEEKSKKITCFKDKQIENQAFLKHADRELRPREFKKQQMKKNYKLKRRAKSSIDISQRPTIENEEGQRIARNMKIPEIFNVERFEITELDSDMMSNFKKLIQTSHHSTKALFQAHKQRLRSMPNHQSNSQLEAHQIKDKIPSFIHIKSPSQSKKGQFKSSSSGDLNKILFHPSNKNKRQAYQLTHQQIVNLESTKQSIRQTTLLIEQNDKTKETIVFTRLKKLLYGDRKGRFIQQNTFKTRVKNEFSDEYLKVVEEQKSILNNFKGSQRNRRDLVQKFSNILGEFKRVDKNALKQFHYRSYLNDLSV